MADDPLSPGTGEFRIAKHFDVLTNPRRLQPKRGMSSHTASTGIGNIIVASDGLMYGTGLDNDSGGTVGELYVLPGYGSGDDWRELSPQHQEGVTAPDASKDTYAFLVDWADSGESVGRKLFWATSNRIVSSPYDGSANGTSAESLTFSSIGQGIVHPKDKYLYFPYRTTTTPYIGLIAPGSNLTENFTALQLPLAYRAYHLSHYGDYLAIPMTGVSAVSLVDSNVVALWNRDTTNALFSETIRWGNGSLKVFNNIQGMLIGVTEHGSASLQGGTTQDYNSIQIKVWAGGAEPTVVKEIKAISLSGASGQPSVSINPRVNFIYNNRLYFSVNVNPNDGIQPSRAGLWSVGKSKMTGEWTVNLEHVATNTNTETSVLAAAMVGDYVEMVHSSVGTLVKSTNGNPSSTTFGATSVFESGINPQMDGVDRVVKKQLMAVQVNCEKLPTNASIVVKYRVDSNGDDDDWTTIGTLSTAGEVFIERTHANGETFIDGVNYEFRIESTGGAVITSYSYAYETLQSNLYAA